MRFMISIPSTLKWTSLTLPTEQSQRRSFFRFRKRISLRPFHSQVPLVPVSIMLLDCLEEGVLNKEGLRYNDEFVKHKILDDWRSVSARKTDLGRIQRL